MNLSEFALIDKYLFYDKQPRSDVILGIGDDSAILKLTTNRNLVVTMDTLVNGCHFREDCNPEFLGHKALAVNLSDLAAMGANPVWVMLSITMSKINEAWLEAFIYGFSQLAKRYSVKLIGGDITAGPLSITVQASGLIETDNILSRSGATPGDAIYLTGTIGDAGLAQRLRQGEQFHVRNKTALDIRLDKPMPRVEAGRALRTIATSCIDLSDGLAGDLKHICRRSTCGAIINLEDLPLSKDVATYVSTKGDWNLPLSSGDDYELCITIPQEKLSNLKLIRSMLDVPITYVGTILLDTSTQFLLPNGNFFKVHSGYEHFT